jgi:MarR-like DNA-binding transcriptional regulator SgrR of sgrS sRNA
MTVANNNQNNRSEEQEQYFKDRAGTDEARFHVVPHDEEGWAVKKEGQDDPEYTAESRSDAVEEAKRMAEEAGTMAILHNEDGKIEDLVNYE